jgi:hypothetical protein
MLTPPPHFRTSWPAGRSAPATPTGMPPARRSTCWSTSGPQPSLFPPPSATWSPPSTSPATNDPEDLFKGNHYVPPAGGRQADAA